MAQIERDCYLFKNADTEECDFVDLIGAFMGDEFSSIYDFTEIGYFGV